MCPRLRREPPNGDIGRPEGIPIDDGGTNDSPSNPEEQRPQLNPKRVVRTAIRFIDENGLQHLTMRRLGQTLGVEAMSIYRHVRGRDELLDLIVEAVIDELYGDPEVHLQPKDGDWQSYLRGLAAGLRRIALEHPQVFPLVATRPTTAPWVRPPLRSLRWIDAVLGGLRASGFTAGQAVDVYKAFTSFLLGHLLLEVAQLDVPIGPEETKQVERPHPGVEQIRGHPTVRDLGELLAENTSDQEFESSLQSLLERLQELRDTDERIGPGLTQQE